MKIVIRFIICLMCTLSSLPFLHAETTETVAKYRASFEKRVNKQLDEQGVAARKLRLSYIDALKKLKAELRRAENLKGVVQVMAEIEALEDGEEAEGLPPGVDYRIKNLRAQWERGMSGIRAGSNRKLNETVKIYLKALDTEKRRLTRAGKIKGALLFEEEQKRVAELPEVKATIAAVQEPDPKDGLTVFLAGTKWAHAIGNAKPTGVMSFSSSGRGGYKGSEGGRIRWEVTGEHTVSVTARMWKSPMILTFNEDRSRYSGTMADDNFVRTGSIIVEDN